MSTIKETEQPDYGRPEERQTYRAWYAGFGAAIGSEQPIENLGNAREWYAHFGAGQWDREFENDVRAGRLDWLVEEGQKDLRDGRCTDR